MIPVEEWSETQSNALKQRNGSEEYQYIICALIV